MHCVNYETMCRRHFPTVISNIPVNDTTAVLTLISVVMRALGGICRKVFEDILLCFFLQSFIFAVFTIWLVENVRFSRTPTSKIQNINFRAKHLRLVQSPPTNSTVDITEKDSAVQCKITVFFSRKIIRFTRKWKSRAKPWNRCDM